MLERSGIVEKLCIDEDKNVLEFKINHNFFHPIRHIPHTNKINDMNISPVEGYLFTACRSMQNLQLLTGSGSCNKYCNKCIAKFNTHKFFVVEVEGQGKLVTKANFIYNTKVTSSNIQEDKY